MMSKNRASFEQYRHLRILLQPLCSLNSRGNDAKRCTKIRLSNKTANRPYEKLETQSIFDGGALTLRFFPNILCNDNADGGGVD